jgi:hypothetical protein
MFSHAVPGKALHAVAVATLGVALAGCATGGDAAPHVQNTMKPADVTQRAATVNAAHCHPWPVMACVGGAYDRMPAPWERSSRALVTIRHADQAFRRTTAHVDDPAQRPTR